MSRVHAETVSLEDVIARSQGVLVVRPLGDTVVEIPLPPGGVSADASGEERQPFRYRVWSFELRKVLADRGLRAPRPGATIEVVEAELDRTRRVYEDYYARGISRSWISEQYQPAERPVDGDERIVFVRRRSEDQLEYTVRGAEEALASLKRVRKAI